jgi:dTDP-4-dehydrorhamnose reductase
LNNRKKILVTGANGQLGMEFRRLADLDETFEFTFVTKDTLSIDDEQAVTDFFKLHHFDVCINCAAYTAVDKAESEKEIALHTNGHAVGYLAALCKLSQTILIHFSTDYVFDGEGSAPYKETGATNPVNFYGETKLLGEQAATQANDNVLIIRTSWVYSSYGKNFVKTMLRLFEERPVVAVVDDQFGCPTYAGDLASAVLHILNANTFIPGIYHYCNKGIISWHQFATAIRDLSELSCEVNPIPTTAYPTPAKRPGYSALDCHKIEQDYGLTIPDWKESLVKCLGLINQQ